MKKKKRGLNHYFLYLLNRPIIRDICPDSLYLRHKFYECRGFFPNLQHPSTFSEKLQWMKIHYRKPEFTMMVDKYNVRPYVAERIGEEHLIPLVGGPWKSFDEIDFDRLPDQFVLKCTHDSASVIICKDKSKLDIEDSRKKLTHCMESNHFWFGREWPYKNVEPQIIAEKYMEDESCEELKDYKILCFGGEPKLIQLHFGRFSSPHKNFYTPDWEYVPMKSHFATDPAVTVEKPERLQEMLEAARILSKEHPFLRVDFYSIGDQYYFGELTFFPGSGFIEYEPEEWEKTMGDWVKLT